MNPILLQKQLKENASDLKDFCKDLKNWGETMKRKEKAPQGDKSDTTVKKSSKKNKHVDPKSKILPKMGATDYSAWDKFDADAECEKLEADNDDSELSDECNEALRDEALVEKEKGNKFVKEQKWDEAIKSYTKAIRSYSYDPVFYANRALCYLKKGNFEMVEKDCTLSLKLDSAYVKAYQRRAAARESLKNFDCAEEDLLRVLELEPKNMESKIALNQLREKMVINKKPIEQPRPVSKFTASRNKFNIYNKTSTASPPTPILTASSLDTEEAFVDISKHTNTWPDNKDIISIKCIKKPPHLRSKKPLKRIKIIEKDGPEMKEKNQLQKETEPVKKQAENLLQLEIIKDALDNKNDKNMNFETVTNVKKTGLKENPLKPVPDLKQQLNAQNGKQSTHPTAWPQANTSIELLKCDDFKIVENKTLHNATPKKHTFSSTKAAKNTSNIYLSNHNLVTTTKCEFLIPKTSVQFYRTWKDLNTFDQKYKYLKLINPQEFENIFQDSLESNVFANIIEVMAKCFIENKDNVFDVLSYFTKVKRFNTLTMFMSSSDKKNLWKLFDHVKETEQNNKEHVDKLLQLYEL